MSTFSPDEIAQMRAVAGNRWTDPRAGAQATWNDWSIPLAARFPFPVVMETLILLSERQERFPGLAGFIAACNARLDERSREQRIAAPAPALVLEPPQPPDVERWLAAFDESAATERRRRHADIDELFRRRSIDAETARVMHAQVGDVGEAEIKAREVLQRGEAPPGELCRELYYAIGNVTPSPGRGGHVVNVGAVMREAQPSLAELLAP